MFEAISSLIEEEDWKMQIWRERYDSKKYLVMASRRHI